MFDQLVDLVSGAWWSYLVIFAVAYLDVIIPLVPSETLVVTAGVIASAGDLELPLVILCAAAGAVLGDNTVYFIGRHGGDPVKRRFFSSKKGRERIDWADRQLDERGGELIVVARFIPGGRTVTTFTAGFVETFPWRRFLFFDVIAGLIWGTYTVLLGYFGGKTFEEEPWKGLLLAFGISLAVTGVVEAVRHLRARRAPA